MKLQFEKIRVFLGKRKNLYIFLAIGIIILMSSNTFVQKDKNSKAQSSVSVNTNGNEEKRLEDLISKIDGAGKTNVMITYDTGIEKVVLQNKKISTSAVDNADSNGRRGESESESAEEWQAVMNGSGSSQTPFVTKEIYPKVRGVLVASEGADNEKVRLDITNAVSAVLNVPYHRIKVLKKSK